MRPRIQTRFRSRLRMLAIIPAVLFSALLTPRADAQVEPIEPVWMVAARDTPLRCGELSTFYEVATLKRGQVVSMNGRSSRWARVIYPQGLFGFVRKEDAREVDLNADGTGTLLVTEMSSIKAPNRISGLTGSWRSIYLGELKPGTPLEILGEALSKNGQMVGYRVKPLVPPAVDHPPQGFVQLAALRVATDEEIDAHRAAIREAKGIAPTQREQTGPEASDPDTPATQDDPTAGNEHSDAQGIIEVSEPEQDGTDDPEVSGTGSEQASMDDRSGSASADPTASKEPNENSEPQTPADSPEEPATDDSLVEDMAIPTPEDLAEPVKVDEERNDEAQSEAETADANVPVTAPTPERPSPTEITPQKRDYLVWEELESTLTRVRRAGGATLMDSLDELIAEYERSLVNAGTPTVRTALSNRLDWLRLRKTARDQRLALQVAIRDAKQITVDARREQETWRTSRGYDIVGRLVPSAIYDGTNLPRMYRVVVEGETGITRTIGYVRDDASLNIAQLVGSIVGVAGAARYDDALRLRIISPTTVDRFRPAASP